jgi:hypothetical protein
MKFTGIIPLSLSVQVFLSNAFSVDDPQQFNKEAYLDLSKPYTYNWNNAQSTITIVESVCIHPINTHLTAARTKCIMRPNPDTGA